jgi:hypothetical protein
MSTARFTDRTSKKVLTKGKKHEDAETLQEKLAIVAEKDM